MPRKLDLELAVGLTMDNEFGPFPDYESAVKWLVQRIEERGNFVKDSWVAKVLTPKEVARRVKVERRKGSIMVCVWKFNNKLPDTDIKYAMANHFSSCGEIVDFRFSPEGARKSHPDRFVTIHILGQDAKEKAEQLNGSDLGGCKLVVTVEGFNTTIEELPFVVGYSLPESTRRHLALLEEQSKARREEHEYRYAQKMMKKQLMKEKEALLNQTKLNEAL